MQLAAVAVYAVLLPCYGKNQWQLRATLQPQAMWVVLYIYGDIVIGATNTIAAIIVCCLA